jgi:N-acyl-D-amino-acid deacylase
MQADLLITNARIVNGLGTPWFRGAGGRPGRAHRGHGRRSRDPVGRRGLDAQDRYLAPGFIDMHTHSDFDLLRTPTPRASCARA